jgi:hypothetical protein
VASFAMALDVPAETLLKEISDQWQLLAFPGLPEPFCRRGPHIQELILRAIVRGIAVTPIELGPVIDPPSARHPHTGRPYPIIPVYYNGNSEETNWEIFRKTIVSCRGVLTGKQVHVATHVRGHAVAFDHGTICDPNGNAYLYSPKQCETHNFYANCAWRFDKMEELSNVKGQLNGSSKTIY